MGSAPAELVFGHTVRGPLKVLKEQFLADVLPPKVKVAGLRQPVSRALTTSWLSS